MRRHTLSNTKTRQPKGETGIDRVWRRKVGQGKILRLAALAQDDEKGAGAG